MKKSKAETAATRRRIIEIASKVFRSQGIEATGVAEIMAAAGLTHGGFYRHFASKDELIAEAVAMSLECLVLDADAAAADGGRTVLNRALEYLSPASRDHADASCTFAATASELVRADSKTRGIASAAFKRTLEGLTPFMRAAPGEDKSAVAISMLTNMIGALTMARVVDDPMLSNRILEVTRERLKNSLVVAAERRSDELPALL